MLKLLELSKDQKECLKAIFACEQKGDFKKAQFLKESLLNPSKLLTK